ncbi:transmembrane emp24 domain-containing protein A-like [Schistocerca gregaria]|uniref:transmembrane emp24 domain-containing protein A-like n=1 Tax=Schistocerca gregaria TaxID=7010 RepID=UPI00211DE9FC|nr:transmembrane emp24 domain-containing protein A-like [Schistocerca gregaria]
MALRSCVLSLLCLLFLSQCAVAFKFELLPEYVRCFREDLAAHTIITGFVSAYANPSMQLKFWVESDNSKTLHYSENVQGNATFTFSADTEGEYRYCFINNYLAQGSVEMRKKRLIELVANVETFPQIRDEQQDIAPIEEVLQSIKSTVEEIQLEATRDKERKLNHKAVTETLNFRVVWLSLLLITLLMLSSVLQVYYIHRYLKKTKWID